MSKPLTVAVPHNLGREEAMRRLQAGIENARRQFGGVLQITQEEWTGSRCAFRVGALGQHASGTIDVEADAVRLEVELPWILARLADKAKTVLTRQGHLLLDKPKSDLDKPKSNA